MEASWIVSHSATVATRTSQKYPCGRIPKSVSLWTSGRRLQTPAHFHSGGRMANALESPKLCHASRSLPITYPLLYFVSLIVIKSKSGLWGVTPAGGCRGSGQPRIFIVENVLALAGCWLPASSVVKRKGGGPGRRASPHNFPCWGTRLSQTERVDNRGI